MNDFEINNFLLYVGENNNLEKEVIKKTYLIH